MVDPTPDDARAHADAIEGELRALGWWSGSPADGERVAAGGAFGQGSLAFGEWLEWVLVPRLRDIADGTAEWPGTSQVGSYAVRELDGVHEAQGLVDALIRLDEAF